MLNDEDYLRTAMRRQAGQPPVESSGSDPTSLVRWTPEVRVLSDMIDELRALRATLVAVNGGNAKEPPRYDRPTTAVARVRNELSREKHQGLVSRMLGRRAEE